MSYQQSFTDMEYSNRKKKTKREEFLEMMDEIIPWDEWVSVIVPIYPSGRRGRPTRGIETMLRMYLLKIGLIFPMKVLRALFTIAMPSVSL